MVFSNEMLFYMYICPDRASLRVSFIHQKTLSPDPLFTEMDS